MNRGSKDFLPHQILSHKGVGKKGKGGKPRRAGSALKIALWKEACG